MLYSYKERTLFFFFLIIRVTHVILEIAIGKKGKLTNPLKGVVLSLEHFNRIPSPPFQRS